MATPTSLPASFVSGAVLTAAQMNNLRGAFRVLQVVTTTTTAAFAAATTAQNTALEYTDIATTITPSSTSSKVLILTYLNMGNNPDNPGGTFTLRRGSTDICIGDAAGSRARVTSQSHIWVASYEGTNNGVAMFLDSPATTSATTYRVMLNQLRSGNQVMLVNRSQGDPNGAGAQMYGARSTSTMVLMEVSA